jgi:hypothetical protein
MKTRTKGLMALAVLAAALLSVAGGAASGKKAAPDYPVESCYDAYVDCGSADSETGVLTESAGAYGPAASSGSCRTRWARATRRNLFWLIVFRYNEQVRWCWRGGVITYFWRDRWPSNTNFGWGFDSHIGTNCIYEHCPNRGVGSYRTDAWTQGQFHACVPTYCFYKYPLIDIWVHGDGGSGASSSGA